MDASDLCAVSLV